MQAQCLSAPKHKPTSVHSLSSSALEAVAAGQGVALAQLSFASVDLNLGRLVRISQKSLPMPEPYYIFRGPMMLENEKPRNLLNWILAEAAA
ncbi:LysR substrate-binding domain-containing protein [Monaibacterium marinum]|uniref:LysR substrate-binding domain-containing protein n=1 Tax=Pontivivens marinum TaxID=1690039 RepID=UPI0015E06DF3|nr:LysR substrate-binding domain-containing protein [Monaibacterium marinum]